MQPLPDGLRIMAMMICRNEADVIADTIASLAAWGIPKLAVLDGASDDGTWEQLQAIAKHQTGIDIELVLEREEEAGSYQEYKRERLYELARRSLPFDWIVSVDADEIYHTSPIEAIEIAERDGAACVMPFIPEFWLTLDDLRNGALIEDEMISVQTRRLWYSWFWRENHIWREASDLHYFPDSQHGKHRDPWVGESWNWPSHQSRALVTQMLPIQKHYPIRGVRQGIAKMQDRLPRGRRDFGKMAEAWIIDQDFCRLAHWDGAWDTRITQPNIHAWYAEARSRATAKGWGYGKR